MRRRRCEQDDCSTCESIEQSHGGSENEFGEEEDDVSESETSELEPETYIGNRPPETHEAMRMKSTLRKLLNTLTTSGKFVHHTVIENPVNPGVHIADHGFVSLPITADVARTLFGHESALDSYTDYADIPQWNLEFVNPQWEAALESARQRLSDELFAGARLSLADPRLLLCSTAEDLTDVLGTTSSLNVLGTVLITLPAINGGFQLQLSNETESFTLSSSGDRFSSVEIGWLRNTKVQLSGLEQGCFAALAYNMLHPRSRPDASELRVSTFAHAVQCRTRLRKLLNEWSTGGTGVVGKPTKPTSLAYRLSRHYLGPWLTAEALDARDSAIANFLEKTCEGTPYTVCLANVSRTILEDTYNLNDSTKLKYPSLGAEKNIEYADEDVTMLKDVTDLRESLSQAQSSLTQLV